MSASSPRHARAGALPELKAAAETGDLHGTYDGAKVLPGAAAIKAGGDGAARKAPAQAAAVQAKEPGSVPGPGASLPAKAKDSGLAVKFGAFLLMLIGVNLLLVGLITSGGALAGAGALVLLGGIALGWWSVKRYDEKR